MKDGPGGAVTAAASVMDMMSYGIQEPFDWCCTVPVAQGIGLAGAMKSWRRWGRALAAVGVVLTTCCGRHGGGGRGQNLSDAVRAAKPGDVIEIHRAQYQTNLLIDNR